MFIEGPAEANDLIRHVVDRKTEPPVAIYSSYRDDDNVLGLNGRLSPAPDIFYRKFPQKRWMRWQASSRTLFDVA